MTACDDVEPSVQEACGPVAPDPAGEPGPKGPQEEGETKGTVFVALAANLVIAAAKVVGGLVSGSSALLSEAAHSVADSLNEVFLLASLRRSRKRPDASHPFGYGKERYFWSLLAAVGIFVMGGCFSVYQGVHALRSDASEPSGGYLIAILVLVAAGLMEGTSLARALWQVRREARTTGRPFRRQLRETEDPALRTVIGEDGAAVTGVLIALAGITAHLLTGDTLWEGIASLGIAALLVYVAYRLGREARDQLVGQAMDSPLRREVHAFLCGQPEIDAVTDLLTMRLGPGSGLLAARVDLVGGSDSEEVEESAVRIKRDIVHRWPELDHVFLDITDAGPGDRRRARLLRDDLNDPAS
ncbi:cation diffusion facilitator family transporter [Streptomyces sp. RKND-216]|uniref:cation diffusion facilitator family transporter n=1 Tax=Streptomyces sp. RKND-216 TaxID=2562581 RepID=UPI00109DBAA9|nr:cation diffusion facilitator family transporter [Streptomyces sp. RKND-216]THA26677.1 cation diffusion facilitator family transporter [Streptomyces sp. RKND-216]